MTIRARCPRRSVHFRLSPYWLAVALAPAFLQTSTPLSCGGDTTLAEFDLIVGGQSRIVGFDPDQHSYVVSLSRAADEVLVHAVPTDRDAVVWVVVGDSESDDWRSVQVGRGGGDALVSLSPPHSSTIEVWVRHIRPGGASGQYDATVQIGAGLTPAEIEQFVDDYVGEYLEGDGLAIALVGPDGVLFEKAYGMANLEESIPFTLDTPSGLGSVSKSFTGTAAMLLYEDGLLDPDDSVRDIIPEAPEFWGDITVHHLFTQTSGILFRYGGTNPSPTNEEVLAWAFEQPLLFQPGDHQSYSNIGFMAASLVVERVAGQPFESFMADRIFAPLGMDNSVVPEDEPWPPVIPNQAFSYIDGVRSDPAFRTKGSTGQYSSIHDLIKFELALRDNTLISAETTEFMLTPHVQAYQLNGAIWPRCSYGYGWYICDRPPEEPPEIWHVGAQQGFYASINRAPKEEVAVVMVSNGYFYPWAWNLAYDLWRFYFGAEPLYGGGI